MNKILLSLVLLMAFATANAQDIAIVSMNPADNSEIKSGAQQTFVIGLSVVSTINSGTQLSFQYAWNNDALTNLGSNMQINQTVSAGQKINVNAGLQIPSTPEDSAKLTVKVNMNNDQDESNNTLVLHYYVTETVAKDLEVTVVSPTADSDVKNWSSVPFSVQLKNVGKDDFTTGSTLVFQMSVNGTAQGNPQVVNYSGATLQPGQTNNMNININLPRNTPMGPMTVCMAYVWATVSGTTATVAEGYIGNNQGCVNLNVVMNSINDEALEMNAVYYSGNSLVVDLFNKEKSGEYRFEVTSLSGQQVVNYETSLPVNAQSKQQIALNTAVSGMYLLHIYAGGEFVGTQKFIIP
ncbi:T9SS type A sorting domain-containing protein [bacterium]|nr:T9SS type A sorting domain-containing protein [bacterium]